MARSYGWQVGRFLLVLVACFVVHFVTNIANDYFDYIQGTDSGDAIGGSRVIQQDKITPAQLGWAIILLYFIGFIISLYIVFGLKLYGLAPLILFSFFSSLFYVAPPIRYGYHGLGELFVAINMGPIMVVGTYWVIAGQPSLGALLVSIPVGLMVASILYYQSLPDMKTDEATGKRTLVCPSGQKRGILRIDTMAYHYLSHHHCPRGERAPDLAQPPLAFDSPHLFPPFRHHEAHRRLGPP